MRSFAKYFLVSGFLWLGSQTYAQQHDPLLASTIVGETESLKSEYKKRKSTQEKIIEAQATVTATMAALHELEDKTLEYMKNASGALTNIHQLIEIGELATVSIPKHLIQLKDAVKNNPKGAALTALQRKTYTDTYAEITSLVELVNQLVSNTEYSFKEKDKNGKENTKKQVNLLSAAERYYIAEQVVSRLRRIDREIWVLSYRIELMDWDSLFRSLDPEGWSKYHYGEYIAKRIIRQWNSLKK